MATKFAKIRVLSAVATIALLVAGSAPALSGDDLIAIDLADQKVDAAVELCEEVKTSLARWSSSVPAAYENCLPDIDAGDLQTKSAVPTYWYSSGGFAPVPEATADSEMFAGQ